jgi:hypothetical protein
MGTITYPMIESMSNERQRLQEMASNHYLSDTQRKRLDEINSKLPAMWDQYRRELAEENYGHVEPMVKKHRPRQPTAPTDEQGNAPARTE